jgi:hypothetical protein
MALLEHAVQRPFAGEELDDCHRAKRYAPGRVLLAAGLRRICMRG